MADSVVRYDDRMWRLKVDYQVNAALRLRNETYHHLSTDRHWRNAESYAFNAAGTQILRGDYLEILRPATQTGNRLDATLDGQLGGLKNRFIVGLDWYRSAFGAGQQCALRRRQQRRSRSTSTRPVHQPRAHPSTRDATLRTTAWFAETRSTCRASGSWWPACAASAWRWRRSTDEWRQPGQAIPASPAAWRGLVARQRCRCTVNGPAAPTRCRARCRCPAAATSSV